MNIKYSYMKSYQNTKLKIPRGRFIARKYEGESTELDSP